MHIIGYEDIVVNRGSRCGILKLSNYDGCQSTTYELSAKMISLADSWKIDGEEPFNQIQALYELLKYLNKDEHNIHIHITSHNYDYMTLRGTSLTDAILDMCDVLTDRSGKDIILREQI